MTKTTEQLPVVIAGGGPVGLFLAICLLKAGINCRVLEKREKPVSDSRSLGIHPVSLELFNEVDILRPFLEKGLKIKKGLAYANTKKLGEITFESCPAPFNYILACPQFTTEQILRDELHKLDEQVLMTGAEFQDYQESDNSVLIRYTTTANKPEQIDGQYLVGCDGKNSLVRELASIPFSGKSYPDTYIMGDFEDTTDFGNDAAVFLPKAGLIESFPLPNGMRRWVVKTDEYISNPTMDLLARLVQNRTGFDLFGVKSTMLSSFGVQHYMAETFQKGSVFLAGDAAHVISPIGGQGMNLGWLDAWNLSTLLSENTPDNFDDYSRKQQKMARKAARRAELNMMIGRKRTIPLIRNAFVRLMLTPPFNRKTAALFTMRNLDEGWI